LHLSDVHLDSRFDGIGLPPDLAKARRAEVRQTFADAVAMASRGRVSAVLIAGDLFEHRWVTKATVNFLRDLMAGLGSTPVFIAPGNHDPLVPESYYLTLDWPRNVHIFGRREPGQLETAGRPDLGLVIHGFGAYRYDSDEDALGSVDLAALIDDPALFRVLLIHGSETTSVPDGVALFQPIDPARAAQADFDYVALGHYHRRRAACLDRTMVVYPGSPEGLNFGEPGEHGVYLIDYGEHGRPARAEFRPLGRRAHVTQPVDLTGIRSDEEAAARLLGVAEEAARRRDLFRLTLTGRLDPSLELDLRTVKAQVKPSFHFVEWQDETRPDWDLEALAKGESARAVFVREVIAKIVAEPEREPFWRRVLTAGLSAFEGRSVAG
jgi:DNA repair exonuclease SbcCD nuclease subunit